MAQFNRNRGDPECFVNRSIGCSVGREVLPRNDQKLLRKGKVTLAEQSPRPFCCGGFAVACHLLDKRVIPFQG